MSRRFVIVFLLLAPCLAQAVCIDPATGVSGYHVPLEVEMRDADAIVVGRVLAERALKEDAADPDGVTAYDVTIGVRTRLKGEAAGRVVVRSDNTSSRYPMASGEEHLLFLARGRDGLYVNSCGNSSPLPTGTALLERVRKAMRLQ
jgi:hypothetical protein